MGNGKRFLVLLFLAAVISGCGASEVKTENNVTVAVTQENNIDDQKASMLEKAKNYSLQKQVRIDALENLRQSNYTEIKKLFEELQNDGVVGDYVIEQSLIYSNFSYTNENRLKASQLMADRKNYNKFIELFDIDNKTIILKEDYDKKEDEYLSIGKTISDQEDKVYALEQENEELKKTIKEKEKDKNITTKDELVAKKQEIEKLKADQDEKSKKIFEIKAKIEENPENLDLQKELKKANEEQNILLEKIKKSELAVNKDLANPELATVDVLKRKIKENQTTITTIKQSLKEPRNQKDAAGEIIAKYDENVIIAKDNLENFYNSSVSENNINKKIVIAKKISGDAKALEIIGREKNIKKEWFNGIDKTLVENFLTSNSGKLELIAKNCNSDDYNFYKKVIEYYLKNGNDTEKQICVELILKNETDFSNKLISENYNLQKEAITRYGASESIEFLSKQDKNFYVLRGLVIVGDKEVYTELKNNYENNKNIDYLDIIFLIKDNDARDYVKKEVQKLELVKKQEFFDKLVAIEKNAAIDFAIEAIKMSKDSSERIVYLKFIYDNNKSQFMTAVLKVVESGNIGDEEGKYIMNKLKENGGEDTVLQILKSIEKAQYTKRNNEEKSKISFSDKVEYWKTYLNENPDSLFKDEIEKKIAIYDSKIESIKNSIKNESKMQIEQIDKKISEYKEYIKDETNMGKISSFQNKIKDLEKNKAQIIKNGQKSTIDQLKDLEKSYKNLKDEINGQEQFLNSKSSINLSKSERDQEESDLSKMYSRKAELMQKMAILYGFYLDENKENSIEILGKDTIKELRGIK